MFSFPHSTAIVIFIIFILVNIYFLLIKREHDTKKPLPYVMPNLMPQCLRVEGWLVTKEIHIVFWGLHIHLLQTYNPHSYFHTQAGLGKSIIFNLGKWGENIGPLINMHLWIANYAHCKFGSLCMSDSNVALRLPHGAVDS